MTSVIPVHEPLYFPWREAALRTCSTLAVGLHREIKQQASESPGHVVAQPAAGGPCRSRRDLGGTSSLSHHCSCCSGCSPRSRMLTPQLSQGPDTCQQLTHQEMASPLFLPTFLPELPQPKVWSALRRFAPLD